MMADFDDIASQLQHQHDGVEQLFDCLTQFQRKVPKKP